MDHQQAIGALQSNTGLSIPTDGSLGIDIRGRFQGSPFHLSSRLPPTITSASCTQKLSHIGSTAQTFLVKKGGVYPEHFTPFCNQYNLLRHVRHLALESDRWWGIWPPGSQYHPIAFNSAVYTLAEQYNSLQRLEFNVLAIALKIEDDWMPVPEMVKDCQFDRNLNLPCLRRMDLRLVETKYRYAVGNRGFQAFMA
ncbi:hypothetical protein K458DRAFT_394170 [Lentithecium fluviatile CBS 122367]|uniref:Uncharacterized protein n=1 Tax=Lentithecium fluviatile CBS 122367 TaxID=1168545 RepID=A0A6G1ILY7_9PLEO|nr:hypothetical protein K458DRAFT_394170 [Lentithecium fluviatile CBS 122367]